jgi:EAL domain-containing protein (putative c-di-GMP-specific phosphodiesterase class I)
MRRAKGSRGVVSWYTPENDPYEPERLRLMGGLRQAIRGHQLLLHYQPKIDLATRRTVGVEALVRWNHPDQGVLAPARFVGFAEQTGQIRALTSWLLRAGLDEYVSWQGNGIELDLCLNLSARNLLDEELPSEIEGCLGELGIDQPRLTFEITESAILSDPQRARGILERLSGMGMRIAIDDFGTGYSSLSHLKVLPVEELKIDKAFVLSMAEDENDAAIVRSTIDLAHHLGLKATAEGVESETVLDLLHDLGCDMAQGYLMGRPMPPQQLRDWLQSSPWAGGG